MHLEELIQLLIEHSEEELNVIHNSLNKGSVAKPSMMVKQGAFELYVSGKIKKDVI